jgi:hypothetical protein
LHVMSIVLGLLDTPLYIPSMSPVPIPNTLVSVRCVGYCRVFNYMWDTLGLFIK